MKGLRAAAVVALSLLVLPVARAGGQEPGDVRVGLTYEPGYVPALALPRIRADRGSLSDVAVRVDSILRRDLNFSDRFQMLSVPDSIDRTTGVRYSLWDRLGAVWVVTAEMTGSPGAPLLRVGLHDVVYSTLRNVKAFSLPGPGEGGFRMAVHRAADAVVEWATGEPGMAATRIAFRRKTGGDASDVFVVDSDGRGLRRVTRDSTIVYSPDFSPDGRRMMYVSYVEGPPRVYERDLVTGDTRRVSAEEGVNLTPAYRPDGARVMVARTAEEGGTDLFQLQTDPLCCARRITYTAPGDAVGPSYSPDGGQVAFTSTALGEPQIYVQGIDGGGPGLISEYVYGERGQSAAPDWSPDGERIAYQSWIDGRFQIVTVNPDGTDRRVLTSEGTNEEPSWAPDSRHVVFRSERDGRHGLWILDTVTGRLRRLVAGHVDQMPDWSPPVGDADAAGG